jgi:ABC-type branched-subunit amino acid transport system substrate-binding protein
MRKRANLKKQFKLTGLVAVILLTFAFAIPSGVLADKDPIKIGIVLPLSGGLELFGQQGIQGAKMAVVCSMGASLN